MTSGSAQEVEAYLQALSRVRDVVLDCHPEIGELGELLRLYRSRIMNKSGVICADLEYDFHGSGCLFVDINGAEIDLDFSADGREIFDPWRVRRFSKSIGNELFGSLEEIAEECRTMVSRGQLEESRSGWFSVVR